MFPLTLTNFYNLYGLKLGNMLAWSMFFGQAFSVGGPAAAGGAYLPGARGFAFQPSYTHAGARMLGRGVPMWQVQNALNSPLRVDPIRIDPVGRMSQRYIGRYATIVVNPDTGKWITAWPTSSKIVTQYGY
jgi:hypothetical protein